MEIGSPPFYWWFLRKGILAIRAGRGESILFLIWCMDATTPHFMLWTATKLKFSNGYYSVIFKVKFFDKISRRWELPREFKNAKIFPKKIWEDFLKNLWKLAIFNNWKKILSKIDDFQRIFKKSSQFFFEIFLHFWTREAILNVYWFFHKFLL